MIADEKFALYVAGQNNWIKMDKQHRTQVTFTYQNPTSIVNGELFYNWDPIHENVVALRMMPQVIYYVLGPRLRQVFAKAG